jgi:hypothetical protein
VIKHLSKQYQTLSDAEEKLDIDYLLNTIQLDTCNDGKHTPKKPFPDTKEPISPTFYCSPTKQYSSNQCAGDIITNLLSSFDKMTPKLKLNILKFLFKKMIVDVGCQRPFFDNVMVI